MTSSEIQDGGRPLICKSSCRYIVVKNDPFMMKFGVLNQIVTVIKISDTKLKCLHSIWQTNAMQ